MKKGLMIFLLMFVTTSLYAQLNQFEVTIDEFNGNKKYQTIDKYKSEQFKDSLKNTIGEKQHKLVRKYNEYKNFLRFSFRGDQNIYNGNWWVYVNPIIIENNDNTNLYIVLFSIHKDGWLFLNINNKINSIIGNKQETLTIKRDNGEILEGNKVYEKLVIDLSFENLKNIIKTKEFKIRINGKVIKFTEQNIKSFNNFYQFYKKQK